ncbi:MAG: ATP-binding protein [Oscillospiraceae bacterium]
MNIEKAKQQIMNAITAYTTTDEFGGYIIPIEKQRPVFLMGPPGIGKTAIMEQIAAEMGVGLLSYSMTHHTRQSALGLPYIVHKSYSGGEFEVTEYTMSEIISSVYELMEKSGVKKGILFLDEINCVSETLSPVMLQFLQYKVFGRHRVPDGWIVVTAGNPPEYNSSVHDFDVATWDRLKRIDIEPDFAAWKSYAAHAGVHPAVLTYLEIKNFNFYKIESTPEGKAFVTARGWDDLSQMIKLYEMNGFEVDGELVCQYVQDRKICTDFTAYYDLFNKYKSDYQIDSILDGTASAKIKSRAAKARFDERIMLMGLLITGIEDRLSEAVAQYSINEDLRQSVKAVLEALGGSVGAGEEALNQRISALRESIGVNSEAGTLSKQEHKRLLRLIAELEKYLPVIRGAEDSAAAAALVRDKYNARLDSITESAQRCNSALDNAFAFCDEVYPDGQEQLIFVTELTANPVSFEYIRHFGSDAYFAHSKQMQFFERRIQIAEELSDAGID